MKKSSAIDISDLTGYIMELGSSYEDILMYLSTRVSSDIDVERAVKIYIQKMLALNLLEEENGELFVTQAGEDAYFKQTLPKTLD